MEPNLEGEIEVGAVCTRLMGGVTPTPVTVTRIDPFTGVIYCEDLRFCPNTGMELNDELEWGPDHEKTGSYLQEVLIQNDQYRREAKREQALMEAAAKEEAESGGTA